MIDRFSETWNSLRPAIEAEIESLRDSLEQMGVEPDSLRGQIMALRWVIKLGEPDAKIIEPTGTDYLQAHAPQPY